MNWNQKPQFRTFASLAFLQSITTAKPSRFTVVIRLLSWTFFPYSTCQAQRSTNSAVFHAAFVPPAGFGYPLDGLLPLNPSEHSKMLTALLGLTPSKLPLPVGYQGVSATINPRAVSFAPHTSRTCCSHGNANRSFWVLTLQEALTLGRTKSTSQDQINSLGVSPF